MKHGQHAKWKDLIHLISQRQILRRGEHPCGRFRSVDNCQDQIKTLTVLNLTRKSSTLEGSSNWLQKIRVWVHILSWNWSSQTGNKTQWNIGQLLNMELYDPRTKQKEILTVVSKANDHHSHSTQTSMSHNVVLLCSKTLEAFW